MMMKPIHALLLVLASSASLLAAPVADSAWRESDLETLGSQPRLLFFSSPHCPWSERMRNEVLADPVLQPLLETVQLVEIDILLRPGRAAAFRIERVPAFVLQSAEGTELGRIDGMTAAVALNKALTSMLSAAARTPTQDAESRRLLSALDAPDAVSEEMWGQILVQTGSPERRQMFRERILRLNPFPRLALVERLSDARLVVRLAAFDLLEEISGETFGFDPWAPGEAAEALARWRTWAEEGDAPKALFAALTEEQTLAYVRDVLGERPDRVQRARRMLEAGGFGSAETLRRFLEEQPDLPLDRRQHLREIRYTILMPGQMPGRSAALAHQLVSGSMDNRLRTLADLGQAGPLALPILEDFLADDLPLVREAAAEALLKAGSVAVLPQIAERLATERHVDVLHMILRELGRVNDSKALELLTPFFGYEYEDIAIVALQSAGRLRRREAADSILACLTDARWRVRAAGLEALGALAGSRGFGRDRADSEREAWVPPVQALLNDPDEFVRFSAVSTLAGIATDQSQTVKTLENVFRDDDALKGPVAMAFASLGYAWPDSFGSELEGKPSDVILAVLEAGLHSDTSALPVAMRFTAHDHPDVACAALRVLAQSGMNDPAARARLVQALAQGPRDRQVIVLRHLKTSSIPGSFGGGDPFGSPMFDFAETVVPMHDQAPATHEGMQDLFSAFLEDPVSATASESKPKPDPEVKTEVLEVDDIFAAFVGESSAAATTQQTTAVQDVMAAVREQVDSSDSDVSFAAALALLRFGDSVGLNLLAKDIESRSVQERLDVARELHASRGAAALALARRLMRDSVSSVRHAAVGAALADGHGVDGLQAVLQEIEVTAAPLHPADVMEGGLNRVLRTPRMRRAAGEWARRILDADADDPHRVLALIILEQAWRSDDLERVRALLSDPSSWVRRAAARTLTVAASHTVGDWAAQMQNDAAEQVRVVVPTMLAGDTPWRHRFGNGRDVGAAWGRSLSSSGSRWEPWMPEPLGQAMRDPAPAVRFEAFMAFLKYRQAVDLDALADLLVQSARPEWNRRVASFMTDNADVLGLSFQRLLPIVYTEFRRPGTVPSLLKQWGLGSSEDDGSLRRVVERSLDGSLRAPHDADAVPSGFRATSDDVPRSDAPPHLVYFRSVGCRYCEDIEIWFPALRQAFPGLVIETFDIHRLDAMRLNEYLCEQLGVDGRNRLVTPAVFSGAGALIGENISFDRVADLLVRSARFPLAEWRGAAETDLLAAAEKIEERYRTSVSSGFVFVVGLTDGINPCAFATIIFFLSYLHLSKRSRWQMAQVCLAFIAAVFLAYFTLGLGFIEIVARFEILQRLGRWLNWAMAAFALVITVLSLRDGMLSLRGRTADMTLQLPASLKGGIRRAIRVGSRHRRFVVAAFVAGLVVSVLELACTGQMYLPMIVFMLRSGGDRVGALGYLALYNIAFVFPLLLILMLGLFGLRHEALIARMQRHAAIVKFATAGLFLLLFLFFIFGDRWLPNLTNRIDPVRIEQVSHDS